MSVTLSLSSYSEIFQISNIRIKQKRFLYIRPFLRSDTAKIVFFVQCNALIVSIISSNIRKTMLSETVKLEKYHWTAGLLYDGIVTFNSILHYNQTIKISLVYDRRQNKYERHSIMIVLFFFIYIPCKPIIPK